MSRGGEKLEAALDAFVMDVGGRRCLDAGASTGGFTEVLLARGARRVYAIDVGYGQLAWPLRNDPRVVVLERENVRLRAVLTGRTELIGDSAAIGLDDAVYAAFDGDPAAPGAIAASAADARAAD